MAAKSVATRPLGDTGLVVSEIGFGTWGLSGTSYGPVDDNVSERALLHAVDCGINFFDTADLYGAGHSEKIVGRALKPLRDKVVIATKGGTLPHSGFHMPQDFSAAYLRGALEKSLTRLGMDSVDLYQLHSPNVDEVDWDTVVALLQEFKQSGKIREFGVSVRGPKDALTLLNRYPFKVIQANFNLIDHRVIELGLAKLAASKGVGLIARTPLCFGFLTGAIDENTVFAEHDHRRLWPKEQIRRWVQAVKLFEPLYKSRGETAVDLALRFCLSFKEISTVIPGMMTPAEVDSNVHSANLEKLSAADMKRILEIYAASQFYDPAAKGKA